MSPALRQTVAALCGVTVLIGACLFAFAVSGRDKYDCYSLHEEYLTVMTERDFREEPYSYDRERGMSYLNQECRIETEQGWRTYDEVETMLKARLGVQP